MVFGTSPNFTLFSETGSGLNIFLSRGAFRRMACLSSAAVTAVPLMSAENFNTEKHNSAPNVKFCDRSAMQRRKSDDIALAVMATRKRA